MVDTSLAASPDAVAVLRPRELPLISYPYEWCFGQLREAALLTLELQRRALAAGMRLKDASAYNIQFDAGRPILIDTLSFEVGDPAQPWPAYRQFCEHFLAPLALVAYRDPRCGLMLRDFIDGIPIDLAARLMPCRTRLRRRPAGAPPPACRRAAAQPGGRAHRSSTGNRAACRGRARRRSWTACAARSKGCAGSRAGTGCSTAARPATARPAPRRSETSSSACSAASGARVVWDLGANVGTYSTIAAGDGRQVIAFDQDASSVEHHWRSLSAEARASVLPLVMDLTNPSPALGWALEERRSLVQRGPADLIMALALVHHLAIGNNVPLEGWPRCSRGWAGRRSSSSCRRGTR